MAYKSKFNFIYERDDGTIVIYNTYSKALVTLDKSEFAQYEALQFDDLGIEEELLENGILLEDNFDEVGFLKYSHHLTQFSQCSLHFFLALTMDSNFACPYCYENRRKGKMSGEVQDAIISLLKRRFEMAYAAWILLGMAASRCYAPISSAVWATGSGKQQKGQIVNYICTW